MESKLPVDIAQKPIAEATDDELRMELSRRRDARIEKQYEARRKRFDGFTRENLNNLIPEHDRTSCSDFNTENGFPGGSNKPRCGRCALLQIIDEGIEVASNWDVTFTIEFSEIEYP